MDDDARMVPRDLLAATDTAAMQSERADETVALFGDYALTAREARRAIQAYSGAEAIWEWRGPEAEHDFRAGVTLQRNRGEHGTVVVGRGDTPLAALEDLLWRLAVPALLSEQAS